MFKRMILLGVLGVLLWSLAGCETARGIKEDAIFIGDKTAEILDKDE